MHFHMMVYGVLSAVACGLSIPPLTQWRSGWAYYRQRNYSTAFYPDAFTYEIWVGFVQWSDTVKYLIWESGLAPWVPRYKYLKVSVSTCTKLREDWERIRSCCCKLRLPVFARLVTGDAETALTLLVLPVRP
jgi:hypothetical protein